MAHLKDKSLAERCTHFDMKKRSREFFKNSRSENLYLVGDIIDVWAMQKSFYWPQEHNDVIQKILRKARHGTKVFYIIGNHDEVFRKFIPMHLGDIKIVNRVIHETQLGKKYLVVHGDAWGSPSVVLIEHHPSAGIILIGAGTCGLPLS